MALTDFGYAPELFVQQMHALLTDNTVGIAAALATVDTEFQATWSDSAGTTKVPADANIHKYGIDNKISWGQTQIFIEAADTNMSDQMYNEQPIQDIIGTVTLAFQGRDAKQASFWLRRYHAALMRVIGSNRGLELSGDTLNGIIGIGRPRTSMRFDRQRFRGLVVLTLPGTKVQTYGND